MKSEKWKSLKKGIVKMQYGIVTANVINRTN